MNLHRNDKTAKLLVTAGLIEVAMILVASLLLWFNWDEILAPLFGFPTVTYIETVSILVFVLVAIRFLKHALS